MSCDRSGKFWERLKMGHLSQCSQAGHRNSLPSSSDSKVHISGLFSQSMASFHNCQSEVEAGVHAASASPQGPPSLRLPDMRLLLEVLLGHTDYASSESIRTTDLEPPFSGEFSSHHLASRLGDTRSLAFPFSWWLCHLPCLLGCSSFACGGLLLDFLSFLFLVHKIMMCLILDENMVSYI